MLIEFAEPVTVGILELREYLPLGQRIDRFSFDAADERGAWRTVATESGIGSRRLVRLFPVTGRRFRLRVNSATRPPALSGLRLFA